MFDGQDFQKCEIITSLVKKASVSVLRKDKKSTDIKILIGARLKGKILHLKYLDFSSLM